MGKLAGSDIDAVDLVIIYVAFDPLDLRPKLMNDAAGFLRTFCEPLFAELARARGNALDHIFGHDALLTSLS